PLTGTYTVKVAPGQGVTGSLTLTSYVFADVGGSMTTDGTGMLAAIDTPGQNAEFAFTGAAGQIVSATATSSVWTSCQFGGAYSLIVLAPDGSTLVNHGEDCGSQTVIDHLLLPTSGTYALRLDPSGPRTGTATLAVYVFRDVTGPIATDGTPVD